MRFLLFLLLLAGLASATWAADPPVVTTSAGRVEFNRAKVGLPDHFATLSLSETKEMSHSGEGLDSVALFRSPDREVLASVYVYYPAISHSGLAALATDAAIRKNSERPVIFLGSSLTAAAGHPAIAVRNDYRNYLGTLASSAAFIKVGRWMVKLRVSGPEARRAEVEAAMAALLESLRFDPAEPIRPATTLDPPYCPPNQVADARVRPDSGAEVMMDVLTFGTLDPTGNPKATPGDPARRQSRIGDRWCRQLLAAGASGITLLRLTGVPAGSAEEQGKSLLLVLYSDAGETLEVARTHDGKRYVMLNHQIGSTSLLASFDSLPSDRQIVQVLTGDSVLGRKRAEVRLKANGNADVNLMTPLTPPAPTT